MSEQNYIFGVEPDAPVITNDNGGKQSKTPYGFHLLPISALFDAAKVAKEGADKYGETFDHRNYTKIDTEDHLNHALQHIYAFLAGDKQDDHLGHAIVRLMFAYDVNNRKDRPRCNNEMSDDIRKHLAATSSVSRWEDYQGVTAYNARD